MDQGLLDAFHHCATDPDADEVRLAALVARVLDPDLHPETVAADLGRLAEACPAAENPWAFLARQGFEGNVSDYGALDNSNLARVLVTRRGVPITLGVVLIRVARAAGHEATGINFPGHFLVKVDDALVDPFAMATREPRALREHLPPATRTLPDEALFAAATPVAVGLRMLNNVKHALAQRGAWHSALDVVDAQLQLVPGQPALQQERSEMWRRLGLGGPGDVVH